jgi:trk system potassium uptake protein TrkA
LSEAGFASCDTVVVAMASNLEAAILATMALKELKVPMVIAKAASENAGKVLDRVGANRVVYPERDRAMRLARTLVARSILDYMQVSPGTGIMEVKAPEPFIGKHLSETNVRNILGITILEIRRKAPDGSTVSTPAPGGNEIIREGDILIVFGADENLKRFEKELK